MKTVWRSLLVVSALLAARSAHAIPFWQTAAPPCEISTTNSTVDNSGGYVTVSGINTGYAILYCPIPPSSQTNPNRFYMTYLDPDGTGTTYQVQGLFWSGSRSTGSLTTQTIFDSNSFSNTSTVQNYASVTHTFDFANNFYYARIQMYRGSTTSNPQAYQMTMENVPG